MIVALAALIAALGGTALAGHGTAAKNKPKPTAKSGDKLIKPRSLSGDRLKLGTVTGAEVKEATLGKVPSAKTADSVGGKHPGDFASANQLRSTGGFVRVPAGPGPNGNVKTVLQSGPFTLKEQCIDAGGGAITYKLILATTASLAIGNYDVNYTPAADSVTPRELYSETTAGDDYRVAIRWGAIASNGAAVNGELAWGIGGLFGLDCGTSAFAAN